LIVEVAGGIQHEGYGENWEEMGDLWSLKPVFLLSWALMQDPYGDELTEDDPDEEQGSHNRLCDEARDVIADLAELPTQALFDGVPADGLPADHLSSRFTGTFWEPSLWAAPWLWRISGNPFLDRDGDDYPEPEYVFGTRVIGDSVWALWSWISGGQALGTLLESTARRVANILSLGPDNRGPKRTQLRGSSHHPGDSVPPGRPAGLEYWFASCSGWSRRRQHKCAGLDMPQRADW
jgi:hypothetical protein